MLHLSHINHLTSGCYKCDHAMMYHNCTFLQVGLQSLFLSEAKLRARWVQALIKVTGGVDLKASSVVVIGGVCTYGGCSQLGFRIASMEI